MLKFVRRTPENRAPLLLVIAILVALIVGGSSCAFSGVRGSNSDALHGAALALPVETLGMSGASNAGGRGASMRPLISNNTVYTAWGTPIRGITNSWIGYDDYDYFASKTGELIGHVRENGLNALHLYLGDSDESGRRKPVDSQANKVDFVVDEAAKNGVYVIMTIGNADFDIPSDIDFMNRFWEFYSDRYKDRENVIFEIANEHGWPQDCARIVADVFNIIRNNAPDSMVLLYSFAVSAPPEYLIPRIIETEALVSIPWTNEAVAFHAYESRSDDALGPAWLVHVIDAFIERGYPIINTEVPCRFELTQYPDVGIYRVLEGKGIAWLGFVNENLIGKPNRWRGPFEAEGLVWAPDYGEWPVMGAVNPFSVRTAAAGGVWPNAERIISGGHRAMSMTDGGYVTYSRLNFGSREPMSFQISILSSEGGEITARKGEPDGIILGSCSFPASDDYIVIDTNLHTAINGVADVTLTFTGGGTALLRDWRFVLPKQMAYTDPLRIIEAANYPYRTGGIVRRPSTDADSAADLHVEGITDGSTLLYDFVRFRDNENVPFNIRAMPMAGGTVEIFVGDFDTCAWLVGKCEINGTAGIWADFSCELNMGDVQTGWSHSDTKNTRWDLMLVFKGSSGVELFAISEFYFGVTKPPAAERFEPRVTTGFAFGASPESAYVVGNRFLEFDDEVILEIGVLYSLDDGYHEYFTQPADSTSYGFSSSFFAAALTGLDHPHIDFPHFWNYRAYVLTESGMYLGGSRRFEHTVCNLRWGKYWRAEYK